MLTYPQGENSNSMVGTFPQGENSGSNTNHRERCWVESMHCYREVSLGTQYGEIMVINKIKKNNCWLNNSLQFDG